MTDPQATPITMPKEREQEIRYAAEHAERESNFDLACDVSSLLRELDALRAQGQAAAPLATTDLLDGLHAIFTKHGIASRQISSLETDVITWAARGCRQSQSAKLCAAERARAEIARLTQWTADQQAAITQVTRERDADRKSALANYEKYCEAERERDALQERLTWREIETCPRDGTYFLTIRGDGNLAERKPWFIAWEYGEWVNQAGKPSLCGTHWLPLPPAPAHVNETNCLPRAREDDAHAG